MGVFSMFLNFIREIIFDHADEYNYKSHRFNLKKTFFLLIVFSSFVCNIFFIGNYFRLGSRFLTSQTELKECKDSIKKAQASSDTYLNK